MTRILTTALAVLAMAAPLHASPYADPYTSLFVLGDSNSDEGQTTLQIDWLDRTQGAPYYDVEGELLDFPFFLPPEFALEPGSSAPAHAPPDEAGGTYTNGLPWSRVLGDAFTFDNKPYLNVATYGATAFSGPIDPRASNPFDTSFGQALFVLDAAEIAPAEIGLRPLVSMWFGMEDMIEILDRIALGDFVDSGPALSPGSSESVTDLPPVFQEAALAAEEIARSVFLLATDRSGIFRDFLIPDLPPFIPMPRYFDLPGFEFVVEDLTFFFNEQLRLVLEDLEIELSEDFGITDLNITVLDVNEITFNAFIRGDYAGLGPCILEGGAYPPLSGGEGEPFALPAFEPTDGRSRPSTCPDPTDYFFIDDVHMEAGAHEFLGRAAAASVGVTPVPLPSGAWLLLGGIGALALRRTRNA